MYIKYLLRNEEPIRIADNSSSQIGKTDTLPYIPGTTIRGVVINGLAAEPEFSELKRSLFSDKVRYLNAYPAQATDNGIQELIPSPKGFCEDKTSPRGKKKIQNVLLGEMTPGDKRAALGRFCFIEEGCIHYTNVELGNEMRINTGKGTGDEQKNIFSTQFIARNHLFSGYIAVEDDMLRRRIMKLLREKRLLIGNARSAGMGKCRLLCLEEADSLPYGEYIARQELNSSCYLYLASHTVMRNEEGELAGLDLPSLERKMGVNELKIDACAASTTVVKGFNRIWNAKTPEMSMYEMGSVFRLTFRGVLTKERIETLCGEGIGVRRNEGFGNVLILKDYESIRYKQGLEKADRDGKEEAKTSGMTSVQAAPESSGERENTRGRKAPLGEGEEQLTKEDEQVLKIAAKGYYLEKLGYAGNVYVVKNPLQKGSIAFSQLGAIASLAAVYQYRPEQAEREIRRLLEHSLEKEEAAKKHTAQRRHDEIKEFVEKLFATDLDTLLGMDPHERIMGWRKEELLDKNDIRRWKLRLLIDLIRYDHKGDKGE